MCWRAKERQQNSKDFVRVNTSRHKMHNFTKLLVCVVVLCLADALHLPSSWPTCKRDGNLNECLKKALQSVIPQIKDGIPEFKVFAFDPLVFPRLQIAAGTGAVHVQQTYTNMSFIGSAKTIVENVDAKVTDTDFEMVISSIVPDYVLQGNYEMKGQLLLFTINGQGKCKIDLTNLRSVLTITGKVVERKGEKYLDVENVKMTLNPEKVQFDFENIFNGEKEIEAQIQNVLNENWKDVFEDVSDAYAEATASVYKNAAQQIFSKVPYDEIFLS